MSRRFQFHPSFEYLEDRRLLAVIDVRVSASSDDAEQQQAGNIKQSSSDLEMVLDGTNVQTVGLRFTGINIAPGSTVDNAYIQFQAKKTDSQATNLTIRGENVDNALTFGSSSFNISSRIQTSASAGWSPTAWTAGQAGVDQQSTDLTSVVQEIIDRPGWNSGNAIVMILTGSGKRVAESFNASAAAAPLLHVEFSGANQTPVAFDDVANTSLNTPVTTNVLANDQLGDQPTTIIDVTQGANGSAVNNGNGTVTYSPNSGFSGNDSYNYTIRDIDLETSTATVSVTVASQPTITLIDYFDTWAGGIIRSTDAADLTYHAPSGHLYIVDSEIDEIPSIFAGDNMFEVSLAGDQVFREITSNNDEPTGITYNEFDGFFYVTNDDSRTVTRYNDNLNSPLASVTTANAVASATDPEGITSNPATGFLYVADGKFGGRQVLVYNSSLVYQYNFSVADRMLDVEGIAYSSATDTLFILDIAARKIFEYLPTGFFLHEYNLNGFSPLPVAAAGLAFAPTSNPNDSPSATALYISDRGIDNVADGRVFETLIAGTGAGSQNLAPQVNAGAGGITLIPSFATSVAALDAFAVDDARPVPPASLTTTWSQVSGIGTVVFGDPAAVDTTTAFSEAGIYVLRLTANDGSLITTDDVTLDVRRGVERRISFGLDDAEESGSGNVSLTSSDLELVNDGSNQTVGLRFQNILVPQGAIISQAKIQFQTDELNSGSISLSIQGHNVDNSSVFTSAKNNISSRARTSNSTSWSPLAWNTIGQAGPNQLTTDFASVVQQIVNRAGWASGNAMSLIITGTGKRVAESFEGEPAYGPLLRIEFSSAIPAVALVLNQNPDQPKRRDRVINEAFGRLPGNAREVAAVTGHDVSNVLVKKDSTRQEKFIQLPIPPAHHVQSCRGSTTVASNPNSIDTYALDEILASEAWVA